MGYVVEREQLGFGILKSERETRLVVEVKNEPVSIADFYQAKRYGEVFDAKYAFLISSEPIPEAVRRFIAQRPPVVRYHYSGGERRVIFGQISAGSEELSFDDFGD